MKLVSKSLKLLKSKIYSKKKCFFPWRCPKMLLGHTASDSKRAQYRNVSVSRWTIWWCYTLRDELLDAPEAFKEHEALADILRNSLILATANLQWTLQAFYKFKSHLNTMAINMDVIEVHLLRNVQEINFKIPRCQSILTALFRAWHHRNESSGLLSH